MKIGRVTGTVVASQKEPLMDGLTMLVVRQLGVGQTDIEATRLGELHIDTGLGFQLRRQFGPQPRGQSAPAGIVRHCDTFALHPYQTEVAA